MGTTLALLAGLGLLYFVTRPSGPRKGIASAPDRQWYYTVQEGDSPTSITDDVLGSDRRYVELIDANPGFKTVGERLSPWSTGYNFASLNPGDILKLPLAWNDHIDELGNYSATSLPKG